MRLIAVLTAAAAAAAVLSSAAVATASPTTRPATQRIVVRPVHANGTPVAGYTVTNEKIAGFTCTEGTSTVAVSPNIRFCGFSATYTVACWKSTNHTALCLRDPRRKALVRIRYTGSFKPVAAPKKPAPQYLRLGDAAVCSIRDGGAWGKVLGHPNYVGFYSCTKTGNVYARSGDGVNRAHQPWTVQTWQPVNGTKIVSRVVTKAWFVGTAK